MRPIVSLLTLLLVTQSVAAGAERPDTPEIRLSPAREGQWRVEFVLPRPADSLWFVRNPKDWRTSHWLPIDAGFELRHTPGGDVLLRKDGRPFRRAVLDVPARYVLLPKDYAPFSPFSDGGVLIHTGQFHACAATQCGDDPRWTIRVEPPANAHLIVGGGLSGEPISFKDFGDGTNVYAGKSNPLGSGRFLAVIDQALPRGVSAMLEQTLPAFMDIYAEQLGPLPTAPMLFVSLDPRDESSGSASQGGTLPGQIFMHLFGEGWRRPNANLPQGWLEWFFAHEAAHLFQMNGVDQSTIPTDSAWIHEGGAEAMAALAVVRSYEEFGAYVEGRKSAAFEACAKGLVELGGALNGSAREGAFQNYYSCGLLINLAIDAEMRGGGAGDLFDAWSLFLGRVRNGAPWNESVFLQAARDAGAPKAVLFAASLASTTQEDPAGFLRQGLEDAGLRVGE